MKQQLELLLNKLIYFKLHDRQFGLCLASRYAVVNCHDLLRYIEDNRPSETLHPTFFDAAYYDRYVPLRASTTLLPLFYWPLENIDVRIEFVKYLITLQ